MGIPVRDPVLVVSRSAAVSCLGKWYLKTLRVFNAAGTQADNDALYFLIREMRPRLVFMESSFNYSATPLLAGELIKRLPGLHIAVFSIGDYQAENALRFIRFGVESYVDLRCGIGAFRKGVKKILRGERYVSENVLLAEEQLPDEVPAIRERLTPRQEEIKNLVINGKTNPEIADILHISEKTVENHKLEIFRMFNVKNGMGLFRELFLTGNIRKEDLCV
jgi:DNA-binding NarL/FixJ family response regulator